MKIYVIIILENTYTIFMKIGQLWLTTCHEPNEKSCCFKWNKMYIIEFFDPM